jgi:hypothetical protein
LGMVLPHLCLLATVFRVSWNKFVSCRRDARHLGFIRKLKIIILLWISQPNLYQTWCHPWMDDGMDGWMESFTKNDHKVLYYM